MKIPSPWTALPDELVTLAREYADGTREAVEPRDAATVLLLRDGAGPGPEVYLLRRQTSMEFAGGMCVFPGGGVDPRDFAEEGDAGDAGNAGADDAVWAGPSPEEWALQLGTGPEQARALVCAAARETFEESGVLLAGESPTSVVADTTGDDWEADRVALESHELAFTDLLARRGLVLRTDLLAPWDAWTTPVFEPRRYRTWFFVARLPEGQRTRDVSSESSAVVWLPAAEVLDRVDAGEVAMMPPTYLNCLDVARWGSADEAVASGAGRTLTMHTPVVEPLDADAGTSALSTPGHLLPLLEERRAGS